MTDKYDEAIAHLTAYPSDIYYAWEGPYHCEGGCLFQYAGKLSTPYIGCLTFIRKYETDIAETPELTAAIRADKRIPKDPHDITVDDLPVFAEWQRKIDAMGVR